MNIKRTIRNMTAGVAMLASVASAQAGSGSLRAIQPVEGDGKAYVEAQAFYGLPGDVQGFTFVDLNQDGAGYFGKTTVTRDLGIGQGVSARALAVHCNDLASEGKLGVQADVPFLPKRVYANVAYSPLTVAGDGAENRNTLDYFVTGDLGHGFTASSFGQWEKGDFTYGEFELAKGFDVRVDGKAYHVTLSYNPALCGDGDAVPTLEQRVAVGVSF
jgi:hypothetical protein